MNDAMLCFYNNEREEFIEQKMFFYRRDVIFLNTQVPGVEYVSWALYLRNLWRARQTGYENYIYKQKFVEVYSLPREHTLSYRLAHIKDSNIMTALTTVGKIKSPKEKLESKVAFTILQLKGLM